MLTCEVKADRFGPPLLHPSGWIGRGAREDRGKSLGLNSRRSGTVLLPSACTILGKSLNSLRGSVPHLGMINDSCCQGCENCARSFVGPCVRGVSAGGHGRARREEAAMYPGHFLDPVLRNQGSWKAEERHFQGWPGRGRCQALLRWGSCPAQALSAPERQGWGN